MCDTATQKRICLSLNTGAADNETDTHTTLNILVGRAWPHKNIALYISWQNWKSVVLPLNLQRLFLIGLVFACVLHTGANTQYHIDMVHPCTLYLLHLHATIFTPFQAAPHN
jgi:hypothetical protein